MAFIDHIEINNFKSIRRIEMKPQRINIFVGKPNVGKSNMIEAISLYGADHVSKSVSEFVRYEEVQDLFFDGNINEAVLIESNRGKATIKYLPASESVVLLAGETLEMLDNIENAKYIEQIREEFLN